MAMATLRRKLSKWALALMGQFTAHHDRLIQGKLELMEPFARYHADIKP
jgi:hypothetical protein